MESQALLNSKSSDNLRTVSCPNCNVIWLVPGLCHGETFACRGCGFVLVAGGMSKISLGSDAVVRIERGWLVTKSGLKKV
jgi:uncharacterized paraquat-inducible protein A